MISDGANYLPEMWWMTFFPAIAIVFVVLGFNFVGDGIRDMFDKGGQS
jgi:peptide/nickel transport system permease protein